MVQMVAVVPAPPLLVPELTVDAVAEIARLRGACLDVATRLGAGCDRWTVVGAGTGDVPDQAWGSFRGYGVDVRAALTPDAGDAAAAHPTADLPLPLLIAGWLRDRAAAHVHASALLVAPEASTSACRSAGEHLAATLAPDARLLVVGDGATTLTEKAPGYLDPRADGFEAQVAAAFASADPAGLLALDADLAAELGAVGRAPWQALAGAVLASGPGWTGELLYSEAPYGVGYHVALWTRDR